MPTTYVPPEHHVVRYVPWARLRKDADDNVVGIFGAAFRLRESEEYLSATWAEHFGGTHDECVVAAIKAIRGSNVKVTAKSGFAIGNVGKVKEVCLADKEKYKIRVIHEPEDDNPGHTALRRSPRDNEPLLELLAEDAWGAFLLNKDIAN